MLAENYKPNWNHNNTIVVLNRSIVRSCKLIWRFHLHCKRAKLQIRDRSSTYNAISKKKIEAEPP